MVAEGAVGAGVGPEAMQITTIMMVAETGVVSEGVGVAGSGVEEV
jgi:hypothetical protein